MDIIPYKILLSIGDEELKEALLLYQVKDETGTIERNFRTISINSVVSVPSMNIIISNAIKFAKEQEE